MKREVYDLIESYDSIIIVRHKNPDLDAYGSQFGMYYILKNRYPQKNIYVVGDSNSQNYFQDFDEVSIETRSQSLVFILDTVVKQMLNEIDYKYYSKLVLIDHHRNLPDIEYDYYFRNIESSSTSEMIAQGFEELGFDIPQNAARALYMGIIGDTGRFMYNSTTSNTLLITSKLLAKGINIQEIHDLIYLESYNSKRLKNIFFNSIELTKKNVAYRKNDLAFLDEYKLDSNYVSRGLISQMSGMKEIPIWANFTYDRETSKIVCELRSRDYPVLEVAQKYGGGGHLYACGCTVNTWDDVDKVIKDLNKLI